MKLLVTSVATRYYSKHTSTFNHCKFRNLCAWPCGPMDKASDFESEDCGFDPHHGRIYFASKKTQFCKQLLFHEGNRLYQERILYLWSSIRCHDKLVQI